MATDWIAHTPKRFAGRPAGIDPYTLVDAVHGDGNRTIGFAARHVKWSTVTAYRFMPEGHSA